MDALVADICNGLFLNFFGVPVVILIERETVHQRYILCRGRSKNVDLHFCDAFRNLMQLNHSANDKET